MADAKRRLMIEILSDGSGVRKGVSEAESALAGFTGGVKRVGGVLAGAFAVDKIAEFAGDAIGAASDLNETVSKTQVIFGPAADEVIAFGKGAATSLGQSEKAALDAASQFALFGKAAGLSGKPLVGFSSDMVTLAGDMASFSNTSPEQAFEAIGAALRGESEPIRKYGVLLDDATLKARALKLGIYDGTGVLTQQQRVLAAQAEILAQTSSAQGDFARTSGGLANQQRILSASFENAKAKIGAALLPAMTALTRFITEKLIPAVQKIAEWVNTNLVPAFKVLAGFIMDTVIPAIKAVFDFLMDNKEVLIGVGVAILAGVVPAFVAWAVAAGAAAVATIAAAAPVIALGVVIAALVTGVVFAVKAIIDHWDEIVEFFKALPGKVLDFLKDLPDKMLDLGKKVLGGLLDGIVWLATTGLYEYFIGIPLLILGWMPNVASWLFDVGKKVLGGLLEGIKWLATNGLYQYFIGIPLMIGGWIIDADKWLFSKGLQIVGGLWNGMTSMFTDVANWVIGLPSTVLGLLGDGLHVLYQWGLDLVKGIVRAIKSAPGVIIDALASIIPGGKSTLSKIVDAFNFVLPGFAEGGFVGGPTGAPQLAVVHGGEYVMSNAMLASGSGGGTVNNLTVNINAGMGSDPRAIADAVVAAVSNWRSRNGPAPWMAA